MSHSILTGYIPRAIFFERANPVHPGDFCLIPAPGQNMMVEFRGLGKIFSNSKKLLLKLAKNPKKKLRKLRDSTNILFGELNETFIF